MELEFHETTPRSLEAFIDIESTIIFYTYLPKKRHILILTEHILTIIFADKKIEINDIKSDGLKRFVSHQQKKKVEAIENKYNNIH